VDDRAANAIYEYFKEQFDYCKIIPTDKNIVVEYCSDGKDEKIVFHTLFGRRVNDCLSRAIAFAIARTQHRDVELGISDNGFYITGSKLLKPIAALKLLKSDKLEMIMRAAIEKSEVLKRRFRHCATRAFMILRNYLGHQKRVGRQAVSSMILMTLLKRIDENFTILKEARRECLEDVMDIGNATKVLQGVEKGEISITEMQNTIPSPFALNLALQGYSDVLRIEDKYEFLRRMHEQILAKIGGSKVELVNGGEFVARSQEARKEFKDQLRSEVESLEVSTFMKAELIRVVNGERSSIDSKTIELLTSEQINSWPDELRKFAETVRGDLKSSAFSYEDFWKEEEEKLTEAEEEHKRLLFDEFNDGAKKLRVDPQIRYDVYKMIAGDKEGFRIETVQWVKENFAKGVARTWKDNIAKFLQGKAKSL
ncbi:MAG TPA: hypothetical protein VJJ82_00775, partial [Candidatus Nanoarchaeia archaeon]|nr:hypothetical protein [Candidatus Nanoarchaeia archaeon]